MMNNDSIELTSADFDRAMMQRAIALALKGMGYVAPNPLVGCVIAHGGSVIGEGYHAKFGEAHAEVNAIASVQNPELLKEATLYVTLEPCAHYGKTPPCADLIVSFGIPRVVIGAMDPFPLVNGRGAQRLREAGVDVKENIEREACREVNRRFFCFQEKKRPYIILKWAQTSDGFMDVMRKSGEKGVRWISGPETKALVHQWRSEESAILVGRNTVVNDNPQLTVREVSGKSPLRIVLTQDAQLPEGSAVLDQAAPTWIVNNQLSDKIGNIDWLQCADVHDLSEVLQTLHARNIQSIFVEGGAKVLHSFIDAGLWDEARVITGSSTFQEGLAAPVLKGRLAETMTRGSDVIHFYRNQG
jgi:diaminohydroxyphosphoribosylaminopyrimidine deaminase/5-amino-6-(5-phosphoribosylamino)uracil reductase